MWDTWLQNSTLPALEQTAAFAQKRHMVLAGNIANRDVPGYKTRDLDVDAFKDALHEAVTKPPTNSLGSQHTSLQPTAMERARDLSNQILYHDGSDVSYEQQVTQLSKNQSMHDMSIALMRSQLQTLQVAIRESVNV
jgi:flagellar basal-body rod protein FlgB